jgi:hypothetical protein
MARTSETLTQAEVDAYKKFCADNNIVNDESQAGLANGDQIGNYIVFQWGEDITPATLAVALEKLRDRIAFYTPAQAKYKVIADEDITRANKLDDWFKGPGNTSLVKTGEEAFENSAALLIELRGREISAKNIHDAIGRISFKSGLHFVPSPRRMDPRQHQDQGEGFISKDADPHYRRGKLNHAYQEPGSKQEAPKSLDPSEAQWRAMAEALRGNTHSKNAELEGIHGKNWRETYELRKRALNVNPVTITKFGVA